MSKRLRQGDNVIAVTGNDKGKTGKILAVRGSKVVVEGINLRKKHLKATQENPKGRIIDMEVPIDSSNVRFCTEEGKPVKLRLRLSADGDRELYYRDGGREVLYRSVKKPK